MEFGHQMIHLRSARPAPEGAGIGVIAVRAAIELGLVGQMSMGELANSLSISAARATQVVDALERAGYVERRRLPSDRRVFRIRLKPGEQTRLRHEFRGPTRALRNAWDEVPEPCRGAVLGFVATLVTAMRTAGEGDQG